MTTKQFNSKKVALYKKYGVIKTDFSHEVFINTNFGKIYVRAEYIPRIKIASIKSKLDGDAQSFKDVTGYNINTYNGKLNFYNECPEYILNELDEFLNNLNYYNN